jgi:hypothetical protein
LEQRRQIKAGESLSSAEAESFVALSYREMFRRSRERSGNGRFMSDLKKALLPLPAIRLFWCNWAVFVHEVNLFAAVAYYLHLPYFNATRSWKRAWLRRSPTSSFIQRSPATFDLKRFERKALKKEETWKSRRF